MNTADLGPPDLSLEWKRDAFNDEQHRLLNQKVLPLITSYNNSHSESRPYLLFPTLVETLEYAREVVPSLLTPDYNTCKSALQIPGLREMLEEDIERCDLKRTCSLGKRTFIAAIDSLRLSMNDSDVPKYVDWYVEHALRFILPPYLLD